MRLPEILSAHGRAELREGATVILLAELPNGEPLVALVSREPPGHEFASGRARAIYGSKALKVLRPGEKEEIEALDLLEKFADRKVSFTDCISFVLMRRNRIKRAFTFDGHFLRAGFNQWP